MSEEKPVRPIRPTPVGDDLARDLLQIIADSSHQATYSMAMVIDKNTLMMMLSSYVVRRDAAVFNHAYGVAQTEIKEGRK